MVSFLQNCLARQVSDVLLLYFYSYLIFLLFLYAQDQVRALEGKDLNVDHPVTTADYLALLRNSDVPNQLQLKFRAICVVNQTSASKKRLVKNTQIIIKSLHKKILCCSFLAF